MDFRESCGGFSWWGDRETEIWGNQVTDFNDYLYYLYSITKKNNPEVDLLLGTGHMTKKYLKRETLVRLRRLESALTYLQARLETKETGKPLTIGIYPDPGDLEFLLSSIRQMLDGNSPVDAFNEKAQPDAAKVDRDLFLAIYVLTEMEDIRQERKAMFFKDDEIGTTPKEAAFQRVAARTDESEQMVELAYMKHNKQARAMLDMIPDFSQ